MSPKLHATDDVEPATQTLCGRPAKNVDNAHPTCKRCLQVIAARLKTEERLSK